MKKRRQSQAGMTLVELMLASGILATTLTMIFTSMIGISVVGRINDSRLQAVAAVSGVIEEINGLPFSELLTYVPPNDLHAPGVYHQVQVEFVVSGDSDSGSESTSTSVETITIPVGADFDVDEDLNMQNGPVEVRVTLTWQEESGHVFQFKTSTMKGQIP